MSLLERIYFLHAELSANRYPNSKTLIEAFEISQPTARRDFAYLRDRLLAPAGLRPPAKRLLLHPGRLQPAL